MEEPKFTSLLRSAKAVEGSPIKLEGKVSGHPSPSKNVRVSDIKDRPGLRDMNVKFDCRQGLPRN